jgi:hypothetical protein
VLDHTTNFNGFELLTSITPLAAWRAESLQAVTTSPGRPAWAWLAKPRCSCSSLEKLRRTAIFVEVIGFGVMLARSALFFGGCFFAVDGGGVTAAASYALIETVAVCPKQPIYNINGKMFC